MPICPSCGERNPESARFCLACATPLVTAEPSLERRKTVTALFVDLVGSTAMGSRLDPEVLRSVMARYYGALRGTIEGHGGSVQKFIGDAVVAVFGVPAVHEDDALRAVRAAVDARLRLAELNDELERDLGVRIETRTGINTGEVVVGEQLQDSSFVVGDPMNVAARLEQSAAPGEIVVGDATYAVIRHAVRVERLPPLQVAGKSEPLIAYRMLELLADAQTGQRQLGTSLVGRAQELRLILDAFARAERERSCHLFTVLGLAGVGKSRLIAEAAALVRDRADVLLGRCLSYGDGITFWPVAEIVRGAAGIDEDDRGEGVARKIAKLLENAGGETVARVVSQLIGALEGKAQAEESLWAVRRLFESMAQRRPLVVVFEDIHWAEPTLLDLIEHIAEMAHDAPILVMCVARPELLDVRPSWGGGKRNATVILLEPLNAQESGELIDNLLGGALLEPAVSSRIAAASGGTPLFLEEMIGMLIDFGFIRRENGTWTATKDLTTTPIPPTIQALLAARLDGLPAEERQMVELASVVGEEFWRDAVAAIAPSDIAKRSVGLLRALVRKDLIVPERYALTGDDSFRFRHILIRDAAYVSLPKSERATLHERFASWLEDFFGERLSEVEEIIGYHLEQAHRHRASLGLAASDLIPLAERAAGHLGAAGRRALLREDLSAGIGLLGRAQELLPISSPARCQWGLDSAHALSDGGAFERARAILEDVRATSKATGDAVTAAHATIELARIRLNVDPEGATAQARRTADAAMPVFQRAHDDLGIAKALLLGSEQDHLLARFEPFRQACERALVHLRRANDRFWIPTVLGNIAQALAIGPAPIPLAIARMQEILEDVAGGLELRARVRLRLGLVFALQGREQEALEAEAESEAIVEELGVEFYLASFGFMAGTLEQVLGRLDRAEQLLRSSDRIFARSGERSIRSTVVATLAELLVSMRRFDDAESTARLAIQLGSSDDISTLVSAQGALARVLAERHDPQAEPVARRAVALVEATDMLWVQGLQWENLADVLRALGRASEAEAALREALDRFDRKQATGLTGQAHGRLRERRFLS